MSEELGSGANGPTGRCHGSKFLRGKRLAETARPPVHRTTCNLLWVFLCVFHRTPLRRSRSKKRMLRCEKERKWNRGTMSTTAQRQRPRATEDMGKRNNNNPSPKRRHNKRRLNELGSWKAFPSPPPPVPPWGLCDIISSQGPECAQ